MIYNYRVPSNILLPVPNSLYPRFLVNMTDTDSFGALRPPSGPCSICDSVWQWNTVRERSGVEGKVPERDRLELMVLHLPGSMSIMALITLNKESISLFSFLLHAPQQKHRRKLKSSSNAVCLHVTDTSICFQLDQNKMTWEVYLQSIICSLLPFTR